ncbi:MAG: RNA polymerase sigma factor RpoH [Syntrophorhabdus sp. PtaU1.Bin153]|nr:MAG: RNA polymerase sigma factor RpoH [Syntrophorhabdus sp. PtaU1.Bin153]
MNETMCAHDTMHEELENDESSSSRSDPLSVYLREAAKYPMLSREEEREITRLVYDEQDLDAAEKLAVSNLRLVVKIALGYYGTYLNILDLIQEGNEGLLHAVKKYDPYKGTKFSTYAQFWIRAYILKYIMDSWSLVKVGTTQGQRRLFYRLNKEKRRLETLGLYPAPKLLANTLGVKEADVIDMETRLSLTDVSLDAPITDKGDDTGMDLLSSDEDVEEIVSEKEKSVLLAEKVKAFRATLNEKEVCIFDCRVMAETRLSLQQIGTKFQISRERVRQIEQRVIKKARENLNGSIMQLDLWPICKTSRASGASLSIQVS